MALSKVETKENDKFLKTLKQKVKLNQRNNQLRA